jgi:hypothetical protein
MGRGWILLCASAAFAAACLSSIMTASGAAPGGTVVRCMLGSLPLARDVSVPRSGGELELMDYGGIASVPLSVVSLATGRERVLPLRAADSADWTFGRSTDVP